MSIQNQPNNDQFTWVEFYKELADQLLEYKDRRRELLEKLKSLDKGWIHHLRHKETGKWKFSELDPFSVFAIFNRSKINNTTRKEITQRLKELFQLKSELPSDFSGIPTAHHRRLIIFDYQKASIADINTLWDLFESAINYPNDIFSSLFDKALQVNGIALRNITIALFWVRPDKFITLDSHTQKFLVDNGIQILPKMTGEKYIKLLDTIQHDTQFSGKSFPKISLEAWYNNHAKDDSDDKINDKNREPGSIIKTACRILRIKKNIILQGAPGTGKTYSTAEIALRILGVKDSDLDFSDHEAVMDKYDDMVKTKQIFFTTFHQSTDYEDFVEGLKPKIHKDDNGDPIGVTYEVEDGIFKKICKSAVGLHDETGEFNQDNNSTSPLPKIDVTDENLTIFKVSLGNKRIKKEYHKTDSFKNGYIKCYAGENFEPYKQFKEMKKGDIVIALASKLSFDAIGIVTSEPYKINDPSDKENERRNVKWIFKGKEYPYSRILKPKYHDREFSTWTAHKINKEYLNLTKLQKLIEIYQNKEDNNGETIEDTTRNSSKILIIDEINRGNVSKIFGELVTLLEADKRIGCAHPITVTLPYSKKKFNVPSNVYIIGTMNTTDRTTGTLDYAIRRRFAFVTLPADREAIQLDIAKELFDDIESFIEDNCRKDMDINDLMVGHSYFMAEKEDELKLKIQYEVIPLLREYCNDDLLICSQEELNEHIKAWIKLEIFDDSSVESEEETDDEEDEYQE